MGERQQITMYAGKMWESYFLSETYCSSTASEGRPCYAKEAGAIYDSSSSGNTPFISVRPGVYWSDSMDSSGSVPARYTDTFRLGEAISEWATDKVDDLAMVLLNDTQLEYPNGKKYPLFAGCLSFGAAPGIVNHTFRVDPNTDAEGTNTSLIAGHFWEQRYIESMTFGMHIGSVQPQRITGSLRFGGYDKNRAVGQVLAVPMTDPLHTWTGAPLLDITIEVVQGGSPFNFSSRSGYLASGNSTIGDRLDVNIDPCAPYLNLPKSTCDALAADLPVKYSDDLGLYLWQTDSPAYAKIIQAPTALTFTFLDPNNNVRKVNISVPFMHLNLTLEAPLVDRPTSYFPCNGASRGHYALGRAFLQDAFFGSNLQSAFYFLAQAPGPKVGGEASTIIKQDATTIDASTNDWATSWKGVWSPLAEDGPVQNTTLDGLNNGGNAGSSGTKTGLIAGLAGGLGGGLLLIGLIGWVLRAHTKKSGSVSICGIPLAKSKKKTVGLDDNSSDKSRNAGLALSAQMSQQGRAELSATSKPTQLPTPEDMVYEMPHDTYQR
ncbi:hypothetical protein JX265_003645 [Neoarthrinium moseri]|uniref:Peptidase A1 domain-containing protein n=1 Tax=Neoarthrinium moseri TaxID=1658444 RepID=A0A9Q0APF9_9PEZI|nr:hypothetical protein JX265_003645 [Neoarthrinium moseri]